MGEKCSKIWRELVQKSTSSDVCGAGGATWKEVVSQAPFIATAPFSTRIWHTFDVYQIVQSALIGLIETCWIGGDPLTFVCC